MKLLNIIDKIYENNHFTTFLVAAIIVLIILFIIVLIIGLKDAKKSKMPKIENEEDLKDVTFDVPKNAEPIKEDVTFEMPILTQNLENFKKNLEEEIQKEDIAEVIKTSGLILPKENKPVKILEMDEIQDTSLIQTIKEEKIEVLDEESISEKNEVLEETTKLTEEKEIKENKKAPKKDKLFLKKEVKKELKPKKTTIKDLKKELSNSNYDLDDDF